ncbi:hypothetical protein Tco_0723401 [Tanacetum coccineum]
MDKTRVMENVSLLTQKHLFITTTTDKHGVPPTKRLFKVAMLDPSPKFIVTDSAIWKNLGYSEWSTPAGLKLARENLQSRVKEEDSITRTWYGCGDFCSLLYRDNDIKFLEQQNPPKQSWLSILLSKQCKVHDLVMVIACIDVSAGRAWFYVSLDCPTAKTLASHMISNASPNLEATRIEAKKNRSNLSTKTSSSDAGWREIVRSASSRIILVLFKAGKLSSFQMEKSIGAFSNIGANLACVVSVRETYLEMDKAMLFLESLNQQRATNIVISMDHRRLNVFRCLVCTVPLLPRSFSVSLGDKIFEFIIGNTASERELEIGFTYRELCSNHIFSSATMDKLPGVSTLELTMETMALLP